MAVQTALGLLGCCWLLELGRMGRRPLQEDSECSADTCPCSPRPLSEQFHRGLLPAPGGWGGPPLLAISLPGPFVS